MQDPRTSPEGNDPALMAKVLETLERHPDLGVAMLSVEYVEGTLVLRGQAGSAEERDRATEIARLAATGVPVENRIRVG